MWWDIIILHSFFSHHDRTTHGSNTIIKFVNDTTVIGLTKDKQESACGEEMNHLDEWCEENNLLLNISVKNVSWTIAVHQKA